jgi:hypothetical protein
MRRRRVIAEGSVTRVEVCPCGTRYLTVGPVTMALQDSAIQELATTLAQAVRTLRAEGATASAEGHIEQSCDGAAESDEPPGYS